jgi:hypothetical protein
MESLPSKIFLSLKGQYIVSNAVCFTVLYCSVLFANGILDICNSLPNFCALIRPVCLRQQFLLCAFYYHRETEPPPLLFWMLSV